MRFREFVNGDLAGAASEAGNAKSIMMVNSRIIDARIQTPQRRMEAVDNMKRAANQILSDESARVQVVGNDGQERGEVPWSQVYTLAQGRRRNFVELEYNEQATRNVVGDMMWTADYMTHSPSRPFRAMGEKMGLIKNPEKFYKSQFMRELDRLANQGILLGWPDDWKVTTSVWGRNILIYPTK